MLRLRILPVWKLFASVLIVALVSVSLSSCRIPGGKDSGENDGPGTADTLSVLAGNDDPRPVSALLVSPANPAPGETFRILATGGRNIANAGLEVTGPSGKIRPVRSRTGEGLPFWRMEGFAAGSAGEYRVVLVDRGTVMAQLDFTVSEKPRELLRNGSVWQASRGWDPKTEALYSAWINTLFQASDERSSWKSLDRVMQQKDQNFLYNHLGLNEDDPNSRSHVIMEPDCADNPFYFRAYFAWKLNLPFGFHECDRGWVGKAPSTGRWITNESRTTQTDPVQAFNRFLRRVMDGVHSGTARTALNNDHSDDYPVALTRNALRPGVVYADPYGHTLVIVKWLPQTAKSPGLLLAVDAQPDMTIAVKRFWKGNFLFNTKEVIGEPGFKAFRPIVIDNGQMRLLRNAELTRDSGWVPFSMQQKDLDAGIFYHTLDRLINPMPMDPEEALLDRIRALHEQLIVRVNSVGNGEKYMQAHPGSVIAMPGTANGLFLAGGPWEDFSTPNRDLRLLIAMDAVENFPDQVVKYPGDYRMPKLGSPEQVKRKLEQLLEKTVNELTIEYEKSDGKQQVLSVAELLRRKEAFAMAYNPNDCIEVRWGAPEGSAERESCRRHAPAWQQQKMKEFSQWFRKRLHPPT
jgi:hypothetical protein